MKIIRASEIGNYLYCQRAWWYRNKGYSSDNVIELAGGSELHAQHGKKVATSGCLRVMAYLALLAAIVILTYYLVRQIA
jgi:hypothetical protein